MNAKDAETRVAFECPFCPDLLFATREKFVEHSETAEHQTEVRNWFARRAPVLPFPKPVRMEDADYERFIRRQPCVICGAASEHAHIIPQGYGKTGSKVSSYRGVPLCHRHHRTLPESLHRLGRDSFEAKHNIDLDLVQIQYLETFISALREGENLGAR